MVTAYEVLVAVFLCKMIGGVMSMVIASMPSFPSSPFSPLAAAAAGVDHASHLT